MTFIYLMTPSSEFQGLSIPTMAQFPFNQKLTEPNNIVFESLHFNDLEWLCFFASLYVACAAAAIVLRLVSL
jgi:hypothetical protein